VPLSMMLRFKLRLTPIEKNFAGRLPEAVASDAALPA